jgi:hypothetical protein
MIYKQVKGFRGNAETCIEKIQEDGITFSIPFDPANTDYQEYLKWVEAGNTPLPADE